MRVGKEVFISCSTRDSIFTGVHIQRWWTKRSFSCSTLLRGEGGGVVAELYGGYNHNFDLKKKIFNGDMDINVFVVRNDECDFRTR